MNWKREKLKHQGSLVQKFRGRARKRDEKARFKGVIEEGPTPCSYKVRRSPRSRPLVHRKGASFTSRFGLTWRQKELGEEP